MEDEFLLLEESTSGKARKGAPFQHQENQLSVGVNRG